MADTIMRSADVMALRLRDADVAKQVAADPNLAQQLANAAKTATDATFEAKQRMSEVQSDRILYRMATYFLGSLAIVAVLGIIVISFAPAIFKVFGQNIPEIKIPDGLVAISSTAIGALAGLLSPIGNRAS